MSGRTVFPRHCVSRKAVPGLGALAAAWVLAGSVAAQPAEPPAATQPGGVDAIDRRPPLPPPAEQYKVPDPDRRIFTGSRGPSGAQVGGIEDHKPLASEAANPDEYNAWTEVVLHARRFTADELERHGSRVMTPDELALAKADGKPYHRLALVRFDGRLTGVRRLDPTDALRLAGLTDVYHGWLVPVDEPPSNPVAVVFTDLPPGVDAAARLEDRWVSFAGYYFKVMAYPGPGADPARPGTLGWKNAPLLVGRSVTPQPGPPPEANQVPLDKSLRIFDRIRDDDSRLGRGDGGWGERAAWDRVVLHARKFSPEQLEDAARRDVTFARLFEAGPEYRLQLIRFEGRLVRLVERQATPRMAEAGVPVWYEGWLVPDGEPRGNPLCVVLTELPPGLEPGPRMSHPVSFAGYSFRLMLYESAETKKDDPARHVWKLAPVLIGRSVTPRGEPDQAGSIWSAFVPGVIGGLALIVGAALALGWWFRRGDRAAREAVTAVRRNPFDDTAA